MFNNQINDDFITYNDTQTTRCGMYPNIYEEKNYV